MPKEEMQANYARDKRTALEHHSAPLASRSLEHGTGSTGKGERIHTGRPEPASVSAKTK